MNLEEIAAVLAKCAAYDRRTVGASDVLAWHEVLERVELADALEAVKRWYSNNRDWIMPSDVLSITRDIVKDKPGNVIELPVHRGPVRDHSKEIQDYVQGWRNKLPPGKPELIRRPNLMQRRQRRAG